MPDTRSPVMSGADDASPQPTSPLAPSMRTIRFCARSIRSPAMTTTFFSGNATGIASTRAISSAGASSATSGVPRAVSVGLINPSAALFLRAQRAVEAAQQWQHDVDGRHRDPELARKRLRLAQMGFDFEAPSQPDVLEH